MPNLVRNAPKKRLQVVFEDSEVEVLTGNWLTPEQTSVEPALRWNEARRDRLYAVAMFDPDIPSRANPVEG